MGDRGELSRFIRAISLVLAWLAAPWVRGGIVAPSSQFDDLGSLVVGAGGGTVDTSPAGGPPTLSAGAATYFGTYYTYPNGDVAAVFQFDSITMSGGTLTGTGSRPVVLLSYGNVSLANGATVDVSGKGGNDAKVPNGKGGAGGPGGATGGWSFTVNGAGPGGGAYDQGGAFGGAGGVVATHAAPNATTYGDLLTSLQGGSGGGGANDAVGAFGNVYSSGGGGGGGGIEIASLTSISVDATSAILANGGSGGSGSLGEIGIPTFRQGGTGGSGGAVLLSAPGVTLTGTVEANGGAGGQLPEGGGGGGRILIDTAPGGFSGEATQAMANGGISGDPSGNGGDGVVQFMTLVPEPSVLALALFSPLVLRRRPRAAR